MALINILKMWSKDKIVSLLKCGLDLKHASPPHTPFVLQLFILIMEVVMMVVIMDIWLFIIYDRNFIWATWKNKSILPYIDGLDCWWWCHFLGTLWHPYYKPSIASMQQPTQVLLLTKLISLWPQCINLWMAAFSRNTDHVKKVQSFQSDFLKLTVS